MSKNVLNCPKSLLKNILKSANIFIAYIKDFLSPFWYYEDITILLLFWERENTCTWMKVKVWDRMFLWFSIAEVPSYEVFVSFWTVKINWISENAELLSKILTGYSVYCSAKLEITIYLSMKIMVNSAKLVWIIEDCELFLFHFLTFQQQQHQIQQQQLLTQQLQHDFSTLKRPDKEKPTIYADVEVVSGKLQNGKSPPSHISNYNTTYFDQVDGNKHRNNSSTPSITDNESVTSSNASCDNKLLSTPTIKPILVKSKSNDSYNKTPSVSDTEGSIRNGYSVKFANSSPEEIRRERMYSYEPTMSMYSDENSYNHNDRPVYHRSNSEGFGDYNQQNDMSNNCFTLKRPKKKVDGRHHEHDMIPFPIAFPPPPPLSNGSGKS